MTHKCVLYFKNADVSSIFNFSHVFNEINEIRLLVKYFAVHVLVISVKMRAVSKIKMRTSHLSLPQVLRERHDLYQPS